MTFDAIIVLLLDAGLDYAEAERIAKACERDMEQASKEAA